eukprot:3039680-Pyramimonas_sp.AAC.1
MAPCQKARLLFAATLAVLLSVAVSDISLDAPHISDLTILLPPPSSGDVSAVLKGYNGCFE